MGTMERSEAVNLTLLSPAGNCSSSPSLRPPSVNLSSGPLVAKVRPCFNDTSQVRMSSGPAGTLTYTRFNPTGPRSEAKLAIASVPAAVGR